MVECSNINLNTEIKGLIKKGDEITVVGNATEKQFYMEENDLVINAVLIIVDDDLVYPSMFPRYVAYQFRDDELKRQEKNNYK